jgi:hypothetical protein
MMMSAQHESQDTGYNCPTRFDRYLQQQYADYFRKAFHWNLYETLTFSYELTSGRANAVLGTYLREIEEEVGAPLACLITEERGPSITGKGLGRVHFHLLMRCAKPLDPVHLTNLWREDRFGGDRTIGPSAEVRAYQEEISATYYMFKHRHDPDCNWMHWRLEGASKRKPKSYATSSKVRRMWTRQQERVRQYGNAAA